MKRLALLFLFLPVTAGAWTRASDERIARKAAALAPPDLRIVLEKFEGDYKQGLHRAQAEEASGAHRFLVLSKSGKLRDRIMAEANTTIRMIRRGDPMPRVAESLGVLAHLVADANNPFHVATSERLDLARNDFEQYFERSLARFPTVFYGLDDKRDPGVLLEKTFARTSSFYPLLGEEYLVGDTLRTSNEFDDRSTAFGVASVCYSHAVTDAVNLYYYIWGRAGGDIRAAARMRTGNLLLSE